MMKAINQSINLITVIASILIGLGFITKYLQMTSLSNAFLLAATIIAVVPIAIRAFSALRLRTFSIELLVTIAVIGALFIQEYVESSVVTFLFLFGAFLENRTLQKTRASLKELVDMAPQEAIILHDDGRRENISVDDVEKGNRLLVLPGGKIPVDGIIINGTAAINESAITGESAPVNKSNEDVVFSGSIVDNGHIEIIAEKVGDDTTFAKIIELVEEAQDTKSKTERFLDRFSNYYTPAVTVLSIVVFLITRDLHLAITFLVIACPGALVIGAPVCNVAGIGNGAKNGVLIKGGEIMENFAKVDTLVFDKTGTLTKGKPEVTDLKTFGDFQSKDVLGLVAKAETISEHHLGQTIVKDAKNKGIDFNEYELMHGEAIKGKGILASIKNFDIAAGNRKLMIAKGIHITEQINQYAEEREKAGIQRFLSQLIIK